MIKNKNLKTRYLLIACAFLTLSCHANEPHNAGQRHEQKNPHAQGLIPFFGRNISDIGFTGLFLSIAIKAIYGKIATNSIKDQEIQGYRNATIAIGLLGTAICVAHIGYKEYNLRTPENNHVFKKSEES